VGTPKLLEIASAQLTQLDVRRRQVAINVRVIDVNLSNIDRASTSFSFGIDDTRIIQDDGVGVINFGSSRDLSNNNTTGIGTSSPVGLRTAIDEIGNLITGGNLDGSNFNFVRNFLAQLRFAVTSGNAKILTDPTLVIQEGETAEVQLTQDVVTNFEIETTGTGSDRTQTVTVETTPAGLILSVDVAGIDDNGFVTLSVGPTISAPTGFFEANVQDSTLRITLLAIRRLSSGQVRVRDGQTLVLSGIIQDQDQTDVTKVPILGDIPILGALFRSTTRTNTRREVIVMLTPQIIDDSDTSTFGYRYVPSREVQNILEQGRR
jgi:type IV pilus assembly protein PilQ